MGDWKTHANGEKVTPAEQDEWVQEKEYNTIAERDAASVGWGSGEIFRQCKVVATGTKYYWNGAAWVAFPSVGGIGAPSDASYVTINAEAGLSAETQHKNIAGANLHDCKLHAATHLHDGTDPLDVHSLPGKLADEQNAGWIKTKSVDAPAAGDDTKFLQYDHGASKFKLSAVGGGGDMLRAVYDVDLNGIVENCNNADTVDMLHAASFATTAHKNTHKTGGSDAFAVADLLDSIARVTVRKNTGANVGSRRRLNLIEGAGITLTVTDDVADEEVDVNIAMAGAAGVYKLAPDYTIYKSGGNYYAMDSDGIAVSSVDAYTIIQGAMTALTTGGLIFIKSGTYSVCNLRPNSYTTIWGEGPATKLVYPAGRTDDQGHLGYEENNIFYIDSKTQVEIAYMELDGNQSAYIKYETAPAHNGNAVRCATSTHIKVHNCYIHDTRRTGVLARGTYHAYLPIYVDVYECYFKDCNWDAVEYADCTDATAHDLYITGTSDVCLGIWETKRTSFSNIVAWDGNRSMGSTDGHNIMSFDGALAGWPTSDASLVDSTFYDFDGEGLLLLNASHNCRIDSCTFREIKKSVIWENAKQCHNNTISNNIMTKCGESSAGLGIIHLGSTATYGQNLITGNTINNTDGPAGINVFGIYIGGGTHDLVTNNYLLNVRDRGIYVTATYSKITGNTIVDNLGVHLMWHGIQEVAPGNYNIIQDNWIEGLTGSAMVIAGANTTIRNNQGYNPLGNIATPWSNGAGNLSDAAGALDNPVSDALYTVTNSPKLVILTNCGGISAVQIDGTTLTGITTHDPQVYQLSPGQTIHVVWAVTTPHGEVYAQ